MLVLAVETATECASVALVEEGRELASWRERTHQDLLLRLAGEVGRVLSRAGRTFAQLDLVCAGLGPGSFTSLRVGLATAKGLCLAYGAPLTGVSSLAAMAWQRRAHITGLACPVLDARRGEVYGGLFRIGGESVTRLAEEFVASPAGLAERLAGCECPVSVFGEVDRLPVGELADALAGRAELVRDEVVLPDAGAVAALGARRFAEAGADDLTSLHPIYVRKSYAEEKLDLDLGLR